MLPQNNVPLNYALSRLCPAVARSYRLYVFSFSCITENVPSKAAHLNNKHACDLLRAQTYFIPPCVRKCNPKEVPLARETSLLFLVMCSSIFQSLDIMLLQCAEPGLHTKQEAPEPAVGLKASFA